MATATGGASGSGGGGGGGGSGTISLLTSTGATVTITNPSGPTANLEVGGAGITQLTGDGTAGPGTGSQAFTIAADAVTTAKILNANVTLAKLANIADQTLLLNTSGAPAAPIAGTAAQARTILGVQASNAVAITGGTISGVAITASTLNMGGNSIFGNTATTQDLTLQPNSADSTTGRVKALGIGIQVPDGTAAAPSIGFASTPTLGFYRNNGISLGIALGAGTRAYYFDSTTLQMESNSGSVGLYLGSAGQRGVITDAGGTSVEILVANARRARFSAAGAFQTYNSPFTSFTDSATIRAQAAGQVMAFAATPPSQASASGAVLNSYIWDAVTATFTGTTQITTATGVNFIAINAPTYTDASALTVDRGATVYIAGPPAAAGSLTLTQPYSLWVDNGKVRLDGGVALGGGAPATLGTIGGSGPATLTQNSWLPINVDGTAMFLPLWA
jgi:hypothetical protein